MKKNLIILFGITIVGFLLRSICISTLPQTFTWDEAALGYNAYSVLKTGRDEHGVLFPIVFKSFGDFKPGLYIYFSVLPIHLFGLNEFSTRIISSIFGSLSILGIFSLTYIITKNMRSALYSSITLTIMPWAIQFSRAAWESNICVSLTLFASTLFIRKKYFASSILFGLTFWTYQSAKLFTPIILFTLIILNKKNITTKNIIKICTPALLLLIPILLGLSVQSGRLKVFSVFSYSRQLDFVNTLAQQDGTNIQNIFFNIFHAEIIDQLRGVEQRYLNYFSPKFLFFSGDWSNSRHATLYYGYLHIVDLIPLLLGIYILTRSTYKYKKFIAVWLFATPLLGSLSRDLISGVRSLSLIVPLAFIIGIGLEKLLQKKFFTTVYILSVIYLSVYFIDLYSIHTTYKANDESLVSYKPAVESMLKYQEKYRHVIFSDKLGQPYIYILFYSKTDPRVYQKDHIFEDGANGDVGRVVSMSKYSFRKIYWPQDRGESDTLFIGDEFELPETDLQTVNGIQRLDEIYYPDRRLSFHIVGLP